MPDLIQISLTQSEGADGRYAKLKLRYSSGRQESIDLTHEQVGQLLGGIVLELHNGKVIKR